MEKMLKTQKTDRARDNWHARETKIITPLNQKTITNLYSS